MSEIQPTFEICYIPNIFKRDFTRHTINVQIPEGEIDYSKLEEIILEELKKTPEISLTKDQMMIFKDTYMIRTDAKFERKDLENLKLFLFKNERNPLLVERPIETGSNLMSLAGLSQLFEQFGTLPTVAPVPGGNTVYFTIPLNQGMSANSIASMIQTQLASALNVPLTTITAETEDSSDDEAESSPTEVRNIDMFNTQSQLQVEAFVRYESQLKELHTLGFIDDGVNIEALILNDGNIEATVEYILNSSF